MEQYVLLARYNQWMNNSLFDTCNAMGQEKIDQDQGAFFSSIFGTLNHLLLGDLVWLYRCTGDSSVLKFTDGFGHRFRITGLDQSIFPTLDGWYEKRQEIDARILDYANTLSSQQVNESIQYQSTDGTDYVKPLVSVLTHWFNHQTHHRGQVTTMISQQGVDVGVTDLVVIENTW